MKYQKLIQRLLSLKYIKDNINRHPEDNVLEHSTQSFNIAKKESNDINLHIAALFHDIGKGIEILGHDKHSINILKSFGYYNPKVYWLIENHIRIIYFLNGEMNKLSKIKELMQDTYLFTNLCHLRRIDYSARIPNKNSELNINEINDILIRTNQKYL